MNSARVVQVCSWIAVCACSACGPIDVHTADDAAASDGASVPVDASVYVANAGDFENFRTWARYDLGDISVAGHPPGPRVGYLLLPSPIVDNRFPVGTRIVKSITIDADAGLYDYVAMAKRGGGYNDGGAVEWEFFLLGEPNGHTIIFDRGVAPMSDQSHIYSGVGLPCNDCHAADGTDEYDHVLSPLLRPDALTGTTTGE